MGSSTGGTPIKRLPLAGSKKRTRFERRIYIRFWLLSLPALIIGLVFLWTEKVSPSIQLTLVGGYLICWLIATASLMDQIVRPLQTLANVIAALREDDFSFRARGARRDDALGDLALEINALAGMLQAQRSSALEATALLQRVVESLETPVLTFDPDGTLRLINPAGTRVLRLDPSKAIGHTAAELNLGDLLAVQNESVIALESAAQHSKGVPSRWMVRRTTFRQRGVPHTLLLLSDVSSALREEERQAWQRLIRVLGHEINNSLAPIKSIAGSLRLRLPLSLKRAEDQPDFEHGLVVIENRAESLNRFVQAYRQLAQLPSPLIRRVPVKPLMERVILLESRLRIEVISGPDTAISVDSDQVEQLLINLVKNAVEAAIDMNEAAQATKGDAGFQPHVELGWSVDGAVATIAIRDNGPGLMNPSNLFVPFYTTKRNGTGVGLVLARQIAEAHGGSVILRNRLDTVGCEALVRLPVAS